MDFLDWGSEAWAYGAADAGSLSVTELYAKYASTSDNLRAERLKSRQNEIVLEQVPRRFI